MDNIKLYLAGGRLRAPGLLVGRGLLRGAGGRGGGRPHLRLRLALRLGLLQGEVHAEGDGGGGAVLLEAVQVSAEDSTCGTSQPIAQDTPHQSVSRGSWSYCLCAIVQVYARLLTDDVLWVVFIKKVAIYEAREQTETRRERQRLSKRQRPSERERQGQDEALCDMVQV